MMEKNKLYHGDCFSLMQNIHDKSIDGIIPNGAGNLGAQPVGGGVHI